MQKLAEKPTTGSTQPLVQFACDRSRLYHGLSTVTRAVSKSSIDIEKMPLLGCIRLEVKGGVLILSATNLEISVTSRIELAKEEIQEGVVAVPARMFTDLISKMRDGKISITVGQDFMLHLLHARGKASLKCLDAEMYMPIPSAEDGEHPVLLPVVALKEIIKEVSVAAAKDDSLPSLTCLLVHVEKNKVVFAATDRFRVSHRTLILSTESQETYDLLVPHRNLLELCSVLPGDGMVIMSLTPARGQVIFHTQQMTFASRLLEGTFPNYAAAIPKERRTRVVVKTAEFREIVQLAVPYVNESRSCLICISIKGSLGMEPGVLTVASEATEMGSGHNSITAAVEGDDQEQINFNCKFLLDALSVTTTPEVCFQIGDMRVKSGEQTLCAPCGVILPVGQNTCTHSFMSLSVG